jgi:CRP-like cAMP-binding protein
MADEGLRDRIARQSEDTLGKLAQELLENPLVNSAISRAFEARERATQAQEAALGALNIPSAADVERLTRRLRSVSQRLEGIEDGVDRLDGRLATLGTADANPLAAIDERLGAIEATLSKLSSDMAALSGAVGAPLASVPREQERLEVGEEPKPRRKAATRTTKKKSAG